MLVSGMVHHVGREGGSLLGSCQTAALVWIEECRLLPSVSTLVGFHTSYCYSCSCYFLMFFSKLSQSLLPQ